MSYGGHDRNEDDEYTDRIIRSKDKAIADLEQKLSETELRLKKSEWIDVKDRLPNFQSTENVITYGENLYFGFNVDVKHIGLDKIFRDLRFTGTENIWEETEDTVTHWMPLPNPPLTDNSKE